MFVKLLPSEETQKLQTSQKTTISPWRWPRTEAEKNVGAVTNNDSVQQVCIKYSISSSVFGTTHPAAQYHVPVRPESSETMLREPPNLAMPYTDTISCNSSNYIHIHATICR